jgi:hypothetical protein
VNRRRPCCSRPGRAPPSSVTSLGPSARIRDLRPDRREDFPRSAGDRPATCRTAARGRIPENPHGPVDARHLSAFHPVDGGGLLGRESTWARWRSWGRHDVARTERCALRSDRPTHPGSNFASTCAMYACYPQLVNGYLPSPRPSIAAAPRDVGEGRERPRTVREPGWPETQQEIHPGIIRPGNRCESSRVLDRVGLGSSDRECPRAGRDFRASGPRRLGHHACGDRRCGFHRYRHARDHCGRLAVPEPACDYHAAQTVTSRPDDPVGVVVGRLMVPSERPGHTASPSPWERPVTLG